MLPKRKSRFQTNPKTVIVETIIVFVVTVTLVGMSDVFRGGRVRPSQYQKLCFSNQRVLTTAIEGYNKDHKTKITEYNKSVHDLLVSEKYLRKDSLGECELYNEGDLSRDGYISCPNHGAHNGKKDGLDTEAHPYPKKAWKEHLKKELFVNAVLFGPALLFFLVNCL